jgi:lipoic acid synthetase
MEGSQRPAWLRKEQKLTAEVLKTRRAIQRLGLHTVCESARCPNLGECFACGTATFLILGERCTRNCAFCAVAHGLPAAPDPEEGEKIARYIEQAGIRFAVITSVTRDDLPDGGGAHFAGVVGSLRRRLPGLGLELLVPDFRGQREAVERVAALPIQVFAHNVETVPELYPTVRQGADYRRSLEVLRVAGGSRAPGVRLKSGVMVGLGETMEQLEALFLDLARSGVEILTVGQYLQPSKFNKPVVRYYKPEEYGSVRELAAACGIGHTVAGPYVRSSYLAEKVFLEASQKKG